MSPPGEEEPAAAPEDLLAERDRLRTQLAEAADALVAVAKAGLVVKPHLVKPFTDAPWWSPWTRFMEAPNRAAYRLGHRLRREHGPGAPP